MNSLLQLKVHRAVVWGGAPSDLCAGASWEEHFPQTTLGISSEECKPIYSASRHANEAKSEDISFAALKFLFRVRNNSGENSPSQKN